MNVKGMIFLDAENKILKEVLNERIGSGSSRPVEPIELRLCDFDDIQYSLVIKDEKLELSIAYAPYRELERFGAKKMLQERYKGISIGPTKASFDLTLQVNLSDVSPAGAAPIIEQLSLLKRNLLGAPFEQCFQAMKNGTSSSLSPIQIAFRKTEKIYVQPQADRIVVVYSVCFEDKTDQAIARVFLQEFAEAGRRVNNAPPISFSRDPPLELRSVPGLKTTNDLVGYLSIAIFPSHVENDTKREKTITMLQSFRNYLHYHIKNSKSYLHSRMRKRVDMLLHVLNRSYPEKDPNKVQKKTISGKTFSRA